MSRHVLLAARTYLIVWKLTLIIQLEGTERVGVRVRWVGGWGGFDALGP